MIKNSWVKYVDRSYLSIRSSLINRLKIVVPELTDTNPSNLMIILVDMFSGIGEMLNYYIDVTARELFLPTARKFSSVLKIGSMAGYLGKARVPAQATVEFYFLGGEVSTEEFVISQGKVLNSSGARSWVLKEEVIFRKGVYKAVGYAEQVQLVTDYTVGVSDGSPNQIFKLPLEYAHGSLSVNIGGEYWNMVQSLGFSKAVSKHFVVGLQSDGNVYLIFGDGVNGFIPTNGLDIILNYNSTDGTAGMVSEEAIINIVSPITSPAGNTALQVTNPNPSFGAKGIEQIEDVRKSIPMSLRTLDRAVTRQDYIDVATLAPGVRSAVLSFDCGLGVELFIVPNSGGVPNVSFLTDVENYVKERSIVSIPVTCKPSGETRVKLRLLVTSKYRVGDAITISRVKRVLADMYSPSNTRVNQAIRKSDIIALVDNLPEVDYLTLQSIYAIPYLRPSNLDLNLDYNVAIKNNSITTTSWKLVYNVGGDFSIFKNGVQVMIGMGVGTHDLGIMDLSINEIPTGAVGGDYWEFKTYPYNTDIVLTDFSVPAIYPEEDIEIEVRSQYV